MLRVRKRKEELDVALFYRIDRMGARAEQNNRSEKEKSWVSHKIIGSRQAKHAMTFTTPFFHTRRSISHSLSLSLRAPPALLFP